MAAWRHRACWPGGSEQVHRSRPLYRIEQIGARQSAPLARSTLAEWIGKIGVALQPLSERLAKLLKERACLPPPKKGGHRNLKHAVCSRRSGVDSTWPHRNGRQLRVTARRIGHDTGMASYSAAPDSGLLIQAAHAQILNDQVVIHPVLRAFTAESRLFHTSKWRDFV